METLALLVMVYLGGAMATMCWVETIADGARFSGRQCLAVTFWPVFAIWAVSTALVSGLVQSVTGRL